MFYARFLHRSSQITPNGMMKPFFRLWTESSHPAYLQAQLPISKGGLGLISAQMVSPAAYMAASADMIRTGKVVDEVLTTKVQQYFLQPDTPHFNILSDINRDLNNNIGNPPTNGSQSSSSGSTDDSSGQVHPVLDKPLSQRLIAPPKEQHRLTSALIERQVSRLMQKKQSIPAHKALFISHQLTGASAILNALPGDDDLRLSNQQMRIMLARRLGVSSNMIDPSKRYCICKKPFHQSHGSNPHTFPLDVDAHMESCLMQRGTTARHNAVVNALASLAREHGFPANLEVCINDHNSTRVDLVISYLGKRATAIDVSIVNIYAKIRRLGPDSAKKNMEPFVLANERAQIKIAKYRDACNAKGIDFIPAILDSTGAFHPDFENLIRMIVTNSVTPAEESVDRRIQLAYQKISVALHRETGNKYMDVSTSLDNPSHCYPFGGKVFSVPLRLF